MNHELLDEALAAVRCAAGGFRPRMALVTGSGWGGATRRFRAAGSLPYAQIPHLGAPGTGGHAGVLSFAEFAGVPLLVFQGRRHWYEGLGWEPVALPVYVAARMGAGAVLLTNAAGGIRDDLNPGALMAIEDHVNAMGTNPLIGNRDAFWGPRFADQSCVYDPGLRRLLEEAARRTGVPLARGVYLAAAGPAYETPAEVRAFRALGADAVGMSTVPEALLASAAGLRVAGLSCITNRAAGISGESLTHDEVVRTTAAALPAMETLVCAFLEEIARDPATAAARPPA
jgi:inosine/guanosine/xanthosine phosphorylase family protein